MSDRAASSPRPGGRQLVAQGSEVTSRSTLRGIAILIAAAMLAAVATVHVRVRRR